MATVEALRTVEVRKVAPNLILRSAAVLHSSWEGSLTSDLLSFVLRSPLDGRENVQRRGSLTCRLASVVP